MEKLVAARQVAVVVAENDAEAAVFILEQRDGGVVAVRAGADLAERQPLQRAEDDAQRRAVGEQGDRLAVVRAGDLLQRGEIALKHLPGIFAALGLPEVDAAVEVIELLRPQAAHLLPCVPLPRAHVYLAEGRRGVQREVLRHIDGLRRRLCAVEVGGIDGVNADALEALRERADLLRAAPVGDQAVIVPVGDAVEVALRFGVADEVDFRHAAALTARGRAASSGGWPRRWLQRAFRRTGGRRPRGGRRGRSRRRRGGHSHRRSP